MNEALKLNFISTDLYIHLFVKLTSVSIDIRNNEKINKQEYGASRVDDVDFLSDNSAVSYTNALVLIASIAKLSSNLKHRANNFV